jgi:hypothetical protein
MSGNGEEAVLVSPDYETITASKPSVETVAPIATSNTRDTTPATDRETGHSQESSESSVETVAPWPENLHATLELEPKDDSWAYYMEQTLLQFLGRHPSMAQFDIQSIECRTTKCLIEVTGYDESTVPVWQQVMYDIRQQPWSEFVQAGSSSGTIDGRVTIVGTLQRTTEGP